MFTLINEKIEKAEAEEAKEQAKKEREALKKAESKHKTTSTRRRSSTRMNPIVKVLTSATFIRSVFGILTKVMKK